MWKLIRGICWTILSVSCFIYTLAPDNYLQGTIFGGCIVLALSITWDGYKEYKLSKTK